MEQFFGFYPAQAVILCSGGSVLKKKHGRKGKKVEVEVRNPQRIVRVSYIGEGVLQMRVSVTDRFVRGQFITEIIIRKLMNKNRQRG